MSLASLRASAPERSQYRHAVTDHVIDCTLNKCKKTRCHTINLAREKRVHPDPIRTFDDAIEHIIKAREKLKSLGSTQSQLLIDMLLLSLGQDLAKNLDPNLDPSIDE
jgi:hypothetical protein